MGKGDDDQAMFQVAGRQLAPHIEIESLELVEQGLARPRDVDPGPPVAGDGGVWHA